jgi:hypothetical protein
MSHLKRHLPSPAMVVAIVALFVALGGAAYAGVTLSNNSVRSKTIVNGQVKTVDLANGAVTGAKLRNNAVTGAKVKDGAVAPNDLSAEARFPTRPTVRAFHSANQSIPGTAAFTTVQFNSERFDASSIHRTDVDTSRITIATAGVYVISANVTWAPNTAGARELNIRKNGTTVIARVVQPGDPTVNTTDQSVTTTAKLAAGDFIEVVVRQNAGVALNLLTAPEFSPELSAAWISAG